MSVLTSRDQWPVVRDGNELVNVEVRPGVKQRMHKEEAIARGLWKEKPKASDKARKKRQTK